MNKQFPDIEWNLANEHGNVATWEQVGIAVLMDIRRELKRLNSLLYCHNFTAIPTVLRSIRRNTAKPRTKR